MTVAFVPKNTLVLTASEVASLHSGALELLLDSAVERGIGDVIVEIDDVAQDLVAAVTGRNLRLLIGVTCFHEHGAMQFGPNGAQRPIGADGRVRPRLEWYVGLLPTDAAVVAELMTRCAHLAQIPGVSGLVLDFIRWPLHWELELRAGVTRLPACSFDPATLQDFREHTGCDIPDDPAEAAARILHRYAPQWDRYRTNTISGLVRRVAEIAHASGVMLGAFVLPDERASVGQDITAWSGAVDALYPMTYHAILHRSAQWVGDAVDEVRAQTDLPVIPIVQLTSDPEYAGAWDWGPEVDAAQRADAIAAGGAHGAVGYFPGTALCLISDMQAVHAREAG